MKILNEYNQICFLQYFKIFTIIAWALQFTKVSKKCDDKVKNSAQNVWTLQHFSGA